MSTWEELAGKLPASELLDAAPDAMIVVDDGGIIVSVNRQAEVMFGADREALLGLAVDDLVPEPLRGRHRTHRLDYGAEPRTRSMGVGLELRAQRADGTQFPAEIGLSPVRVDDRLLVIAAVRDVTERRAAEEQIRRHREAAATFDERERIAQDLHDLVIQRLFGAGMSLQSAIALPSEERQSERIARVVAELDETIKEIRSVIFRLERPVEANGTVRYRILDVVSEGSRSLGFEPHLQMEGPIDALVGASVAENLLAVLREAISNAARHAHASAVHISISAADDLVVLVRDNGVGLAPPASIRPPGRGLDNLARRAQALGGTVRVGADYPSGTIVEWRVPLASRAVADGE